MRTPDWVFYAQNAFYLNAVFQLSWMTLMWVICIVFHNGSMVDFGWPSGFTVMAFYYLWTGPGVPSHRYVICGLYILAGFRFMFGWAIGRKHYKKEDHRWEHWRERWRKGDGLFGISSVPLNFFFFYHCQSLTNLLLMSVPLQIVATNANPSLHPAEIAAIFLWISGFVFENIADQQLSKFTIKQAKLKKEAKAKGLADPPTAVMKSGLWRYSRHPNYFGEFMLWMAYALATWNDVGNVYETLALLLLPGCAYYYLVHFTGVFMAEQVSVQKRGDVYVQYQKETSMFFPWFPTITKSRKE